MLFDLIANYTDQETSTLRDVRKDILVDLSRAHEPKKIISFLNKAGVLALDHTKELVHIGVSNEFVLTQVKKFFQNSLRKTVHKLYAPGFTIKYHIYPPLQQKGNPLHVDVQRLFNLSVTKQDNKTYTKDSQSLSLAKYFGVKFSPKLTFSHFVDGAHSHLAYSAAQAVAQTPGTVYNPLFLYGGVGVGKTHLLQSIGQHILDTTDKTVLYLPAVRLIDHIILAIRKNKISKLTSQLTNVDVLLIDDVQFLASKEKTQEIFLTFFNELVMKNKQIVLSSDQAPRELANIAPRLKTRFAKGLVADIQAPNYETRIAILQAKLAQEGVSVDHSLLSTFAEHITDNVRELEGALNILLTQQKLTHQDIDESMMHRCLETLGYHPHGEQQATHDDFSQMSTSSIMSFGSIVEFVSKYYDISVAELKSDSRTRAISGARQMLMSIAKHHFNRTLEKIGDFFGGKNHTAVIYACKNFEKKLQKDSSLSHDYAVIMDKIK